jgi:hypothetical protein
MNGERKASSCGPRLSDPRAAWWTCCSPELVVIVAQMACEVLTEQTLTPLLASQRRPWNFNVGNKAVRKLYTKLTHDAIDATPFWARFELHVDRRHKIVHHGQHANTTEAQESLTVTTEFVDHVEKVGHHLVALTRP